MKTVVMTALIVSLTSFFINSLSASEIVETSPESGCTYCTDVFGDVTPGICGIVGGGMGLTYKSAVCCMTHDPHRTTECCYKWGCGYSWFPSCNQSVQCNHGNTCQGAPAQWISSIGTIVGCSIFLPWVAEKLCGNKFSCKKKLVYSNCVNQSKIEN